MTKQQMFNRRTAIYEEYGALSFIATVDVNGEKDNASCELLLERKQHIKALREEIIMLSARLEHGVFNTEAEEKEINRLERDDVEKNVYWSNANSSVFNDEGLRYVDEEVGYVDQDEEYR